MKVDLKLYKTFDADLIFLNSSGISVSAMIKEALYHYCRGEVIKFQLPKCKAFELAGLKRYIHVVVNVTDPESIEFLKREIKFRERSAFIRALLRECLVTQQLSVYFRNSDMIQKENTRCKAIDTDVYSNVCHLEFNNRKHDYASEILRPAGEKKKTKTKEKIETKVVEEKKTDKERIAANRFGDVSDLAPSANKKKISEMVQTRNESAAPKVEKAKKPAADTVISSMDEPIRTTDTELKDIMSDTADSSFDPFSQFQSFLDPSNFDF